jgi:hypothetical protein
MADAEQDQMRKMGSVPVTFGDPEDDFDEDDPLPDDDGDGNTDDGEGGEVFPIDDPERDP